MSGRARVVAHTRSRRIFICSFIQSRCARVFFGLRGRRQLEAGPNPVPRRSVTRQTYCRLLLSSKYKINCSFRGAVFVSYFSYTPKEAARRGHRGCLPEHGEVEFLALLKTSEGMTDRLDRKAPRERSQNQGLRGRNSIKMNVTDGLGARAPRRPESPLQNFFFKYCLSS